MVISSSVLGSSPVRLQLLVFPGLFKFIHVHFESDPTILSNFGCIKGTLLNIKIFKTKSEETLLTTIIKNKNITPEQVFN